MIFDIIMINVDLVEQIVTIYPGQYKERENTEKASGVFDLPLPPTPPKCVNSFSIDQLNDMEDGLGTAVVMQMPSGQFVVMPMNDPSTGKHKRSLNMRYNSDYVKKIILSTSLKLLVKH